MKSGNPTGPGSRRQISVDQALKLVLASLPPPHSELRSLRQARTLILAASLAAEEDSPLFDTVAMDGFAVRAESLAMANNSVPVALPILDSVVAGDTRDLELPTGGVFRIMTGARLPNGADALIPLELVSTSDGFARFAEPVKSGANIRRIGEDIRTGDELLKAGTPLMAGQTALLASLGIDAVPVFAAPRIAILVTGDEISGEAKLSRGSIRDSNSIMIEQLCLSSGADVIICERTGDERERLHEAITRAIALHADLIVSVGGASAGDRDVVTELAKSNADLQVLDVQMKPGRPLIAGTILNVPLIGLPGNPAAAFVSAMQFVRPAIQMLLGCAEPVWTTCLARISSDLPNPGGRRNFVRVNLSESNGEIVASPSGPQNAANLLTLARADGLLIIPESVAVARAGDSFTVQRLP